MTNAIYESISIYECGEPLLDLAEFPFVLEPKYYQMGLSDTPKLYARESVANKLLKIQKKFKGLKFKIWDPWRSRKVQNNIYQLCWDDLKMKHPDWDEERLSHEVGIFVTAAHDPNKIPPHTTGGAIDLTLVDLDDIELNTGTGFDHFGPEATVYYFDTIKPNTEISTNRKLLHKAMLEEEFSSYNDEWWHFDYGNQFWAFQTGRDHAIYGEKVSVP